MTGSKASEMYVRLGYSEKYISSKKKTVLSYNVKKIKVNVSVVGRILTIIKMLIR